MGFIAVYASDIAILYVSGAFAGEMLGSTFHTSRCIPAIVFVRIFDISYIVGCPVWDGALRLLLWC